MLKTSYEFAEWTHIQKFFQLPKKNMIAERNLYARTKPNKMFEQIMDAIISHPKDSKSLPYWVDVYHLRQQFYEPQKESWWNDLLQEMAQMCKKWNNPLAVEVCCAMIDELEDYQRSMIGIITADEYNQMYGNMRKDVVYE